MKEPIFKEDLRIEAFNIVKRIAAGENNLQEEAKQLIALRAPRFCGRRAKISAAY